MAFDGTEGAQIVITEASVLTAKYRDNHPNETLGHFIGKDIINSILGQSGCVGIRVYYGLDTQGKRQLVFVGVDGNENDLASGIVADRTKPCPSNCSNSNSLNS